VTTVVECIGVAGVGKSRLTDLLVDELDALGRPATAAMAPVGPRASRCRRLLRKAGFVAGEAVREPQAVLAMVAATLQTGQRHRRDALAIAVNWVTLRGLVRRARSRPGVHVFDQGALLGLWSTGHRGDAEPCRRLLERRTWSWVLPDVVYHVQAPTELTLAQLRGRGAVQSRLEGLDDDGRSPVSRSSWRGSHAGGRSARSPSRASPRCPTPATNAYGRARRNSRRG
jgi:hypothetical protein